MNAARFGFRTTKSVLRIRKHRPGRVQIASSTTTATSSSAENGKKHRQQQHLKQQKKAKYLLPKRIILLRHGESLGNIDDTAYANIPDWKIPLTRRGERQALHAGKKLSELLEGETLFTYCSPYQRAIGTWEIIEDYLFKENESIKKSSQAVTSDGTDDSEDSSTSTTTKHGVEIIGTREEPRIAEQQFGNFQNPHKVRTAKAERRTFGRFFFRFPNGESGLDVYSRCSSFLATLSRDIKQIDQRYSSLHRSNARNSIHDSSNNNDNNNNMGNGDKDAMENMNILVVCHGLTLRLLLMRYFQLTVEEFENSYNSQNAKLVIMDRFVYDDNDSHVDPGNRKYHCTFSDSLQYREYYKLDDTAKEALNLLGDVSNKKPVYQRSLSKLECGILSDGGDTHLLEE